MSRPNFALFDMPATGARWADGERQGLQGEGEVLRLPRDPMTDGFRDGFPKGPQLIERIDSAGTLTGSKLRLLARSELRCRDIIEVERRINRFQIDAYVMANRDRARSKRAAVREAETQGRIAERWVELWFAKSIYTKSPARFCSHSPERVAQKRMGNHVQMPISLPDQTRGSAALRLVQQLEQACRCAGARWHFYKEDRNLTFIEHDGRGPRHHGNLNALQLVEIGYSCRHDERRAPQVRSATQDSSRLIGGKHAKHRGWSCIMTRVIGLNLR